jgi:hypothetical protein
MVAKRPSYVTQGAGVVAFGEAEYQRRAVTIAECDIRSLGKAFLVHSKEAAS